MQIAILSRYLIVFAAAIGVGGCLQLLAEARQASLPSYTELKSRIPPTQPGRGRLIVFFPKQVGRRAGQLLLPGACCVAELTLNDKPFMIADNFFQIADLTAGHYTIRAAKGEAHVEFELANDGVTYVEVELSEGLWPNVRLRPVAADEAEAEIALLKNGEEPRTLMLPDVVIPPR
jgi:hypothetical protein